MSGLWNTERMRQELGASSIRSAATIILRLGLTPVAREPGRSGMNLYDPAVAGPVIAEHLARRGAGTKIMGQKLGQTSTGRPLTASDGGGTDTGSDQSIHRQSSDNL